MEIVTQGISRRERRAIRALPRRDVLIWAAVILFVNQLFSIIKEVPASSLGTLVTDLCTVGIFQYIAWYVIFRLLGSSRLVPAARSRDFVVTTAFCLLVFLPTSRMIWVAATGVALYLWFFNTDDPKLRAAGIVLAALSVQELWGHILFSLIASPLLRAETAAVGTMLEAAQPGIVWQDNVIIGPSGHGILIIGSCSSFHNLSLALLCWIAVSKLSHQNWQVRDLRIGSAIGMTMIMFNMARLFLMAWNIELYEYWHNGFGAQLFAIGASFTVLSISLYGSKPARLI